MSCTSARNACTGASDAQGLASHDPLGLAVHRLMPFSLSAQSALWERVNSSAMLWVTFSTSSFTTTRPSCSRASRRLVKLKAIFLLGSATPARSQVRAGRRGAAAGAYLLSICWDSIISIDLRHARMDSSACSNTPPTALGSISSMEHAPLCCATT
eukprot:scaffold5014_cov387-Prasinococcus_capsulatus_cf.AAC.6